MINSVRNTVLSVLNKNNYGYISPSDFNLFAKQAQLEVFEEYFSNFNKTINAENARTSGTDYSDINKAISETIESFLVSDYLFNKPTGYDNPTNRFYIPSLTTTNNEAYMINKVICNTKVLASHWTSDTLPFQLIDDHADFIADGVSVGDIVVNSYTYKNTTVSFVEDETTLYLEDDIFQDVNFFEDYIIYSQYDFAEADKVSSGKITLLNSSNLTTPSLIYPSYSILGDIMKVYPVTINTYGAVNATYFRYPKEPKWTYIALSGGEPVFDQSQLDYQDFEMPQEDEFKLVMKILQYCGVSIRENDVTSFAMAQEQHEQPTFSQQQ